MELKELKAKLKKKREKELLIDLMMIEYIKSTIGTGFLEHAIERMAKGDKIVDTRKILTEKEK